MDNVDAYFVGADYIETNVISGKKTSGGVNIEGTCFEYGRVDVTTALHTPFLRVGNILDLEKTILSLKNTVSRLDEKVQTLEQKVQTLEQELMELKYHPKSPFIQEIGEAWTLKAQKNDQK